MKIFGKLNLLALAISIIVFVALFNRSPIYVKYSGDLYEVTDIDATPICYSAAIPGAESMALRKDHQIATGLENGTILNMLPSHYRQEITSSPFVNIGGKDEKFGCGPGKKEEVCGRPLGMEYSKKYNSLFVADATFGLLQVKDSGEIISLCSEDSEGNKFMFTNDVALDEENDIIYFTVSSTVYRRYNLFRSILNSDDTGGIFSFHLATGKLRKLAGGLYFPNGIELTEDGKYLLVPSTSALVLMRYSIADETLTTVNDNFPGFCDNISPSESRKGSYWVGMSASKKPLLRFALNYRHVLRHVVQYVPLKYISKCTGAPAYFAEVDVNGNVLALYKESSGLIGSSSEILEKDGVLYFGSYCRGYLCSLELEQVRGRGNKL